MCTCSHFPTEAVLWIKEVELVDSVDDLKSSRSITGTHGPNFELLDARNASALNKLIQNTRFKKKDQSGVTRIKQIYLQLFFENDNIQEFDTKWDEILLSVTQIPPHDILEGLYKLRIRESEKLKTVLELYNIEIHQKKAKPDYHRLKDNGEKRYRAESTNQEF